MHYQHLTNFISTRIRENDIYIPAMITFLVKNGGWGTKEQIAKELSEEYKISQDEIFIDVSDFVSKLKIYGLYQ